jgi:hypothetical protein
MESSPGLDDDPAAPGRNRKAGLHGGAARIARLPLRQEVFVVEPQPSRLLDDVDIKGGTSERRCRDVLAILQT